jgi:hypothetical protein
MAKSKTSSKASKATKATKAASSKKVAVVSTEPCESTTQTEAAKKPKVVLKEAFLTTKKKTVKILETKMEVLSSVEPQGISIDDIPDEAVFVEQASSSSITNRKNVSRQISKQGLSKAKSGRDWKVVQNNRHSKMFRQGTVSNLSKTHEQHNAERARKKHLKELETEMKEEKKQKVLDAKSKREEQQKRRMANQLKTASTQSINPEKLKGMSKKQLRNIRKTAMGKDGQIELVPAYV